MSADLTPREVFTMIVERMEADNGCLFAASRVHLANALGPINDLMAAGYFQDDPNKLEGSFWQAAAPEEGEARAFFSRAPAAYAALDAILNHIFDGPLAARYTGGQRLRRSVPGMDPDHFHVLEYLTREPNGEVTITRIPLNEWPAWAEELRRKLYPEAFAPRPAIHRDGRPYRDALRELEEAWAALWEPLRDGFLGAFRDLFRVLASPVRLPRRFRRSTIKLQGRKIDPNALRNIARFYLTAADQMEQGVLEYNRGGIVISPSVGRGDGFRFSGTLDLKVVRR